MSLRNRSNEERLQKTYSFISDLHSSKRNYMKFEFQQIVKLINIYSVFTIQKHLVDVPTDKLNTFSSDRRITECLHRLLGVDDSQVIVEEDFPIDSDRLLPTICDAAVEELCDFSHVESVIASQPPNLLLAMLTVEGERWNRVDYLWKKFEYTLSLPEKDFELKRALQNVVQVFVSSAYCLFLNKYWPVEISQPNKSPSGFMPKVVRFLKFSIGASLGAMLLSPIVFEIIKRQAEITRTHQKSTIAKMREEEKKEPPRERYLSYSLSEKVPPVYQLQSPMRVGPATIDGYQGRRYCINLKNALYEEVIFRCLLFRSLLSYVHPALACILCTISSTLSCGSFYNEMYSGLNVRHALSLKLIDSFLLTSLSYVTLSFLPGLWVRGLLCWDSTVLNEVLHLHDPSLAKEMNRVTNNWYVPMFLQDVKFYKHVGAQISLQLQQIQNSDTVTADSSVKDLARAVMSEYSSPFGSDDGDSAHSNLTMEEGEDFIVALEWACSDAVIKAMENDGPEDGRSLHPTTPVNYVSSLGSPVNYCRGSTLLELYTQRSCNSEVTRLWALAMEAILPGCSHNHPPPDVDVDNDSTTRRKSWSSFDPNDIDPISNKSREYIASQLQIGARRVLNTDPITQNEVEALLLAVLADPSSGTQSSSSLIPSLSRSLSYASDMDSDAFLSLMRDRHAFANRTTDYYAPRLQYFTADLFLSLHVGLWPLAEDIQDEIVQFQKKICSVRNKADEIFLRSRGLTKRRYATLLNKHSLNPQVKELQSELDRHIMQKDVSNAEAFHEMIKWGY